MSGAYERIDQLSVRVAAALESFDNVRLKQQARPPIDPLCNALLWVATSCAELQLDWRRVNALHCGCNAA